MHRVFFPSPISGTGDGFWLPVLLTPSGAKADRDIACKVKGTFPQAWAQGVD